MMERFIACGILATALFLLALALAEVVRPPAPRPAPADESQGLVWSVLEEARRITEDAAGEQA